MLNKLLSLMVGLLSFSGMLYSEVSFELVTGEQTGIAKQMAEWKTVELKRWEGQKRSHQWWPWALRAFDYDNDGDLDLIASHHGTAHSRIYKNQLKETKKLTFIDVSSELGLTHENGPVGDDRPWIWDFDGDGFLDIASLTDEGKRPILFNQSGKQFIAGDQSFTNKALAHPYEVLDFNGDGYLDVDGGSKGIFYYSPAEKKFINHYSNRTKSFANGEQVRFSDPEGLPDHLKDFTNKHKEATKSGKDAAGNKVHNRFFRSKPATHFLNGYDTIGYEPMPIDINHDGIGDIIIAGSGGYGGSYLGRYAIGAKDGTLSDFSDTTALPLEKACPIYWGDLNGDNFSDVMLAGKNGGVFLNDGKGVFSKKASDMDKFLTDRGPYLLRAFRADFDNDGDFDFLMSNPRRNYSSIYENNGDGTFKLHKKMGSWDSNSNVICDINNDGLLDVVLGAPGGHKSTDIHVYINKTNSLKQAALIKTRMAKPNVYAVGSEIRISTGEELLLHTKSSIDGQMISFGLDDKASFDVEIKYPNGKIVKKSGLKPGLVHTIAENGDLTSASPVSE